MKDPNNIEVAATTPIDNGWSMLRTKNEFLSWAKCDNPDLPNSSEYEIANNMIHAMDRWKKYRKNAYGRWDGWRSKMHFGQIPGEVGFRIYAVRKMSNNGTTILTYLWHDAEYFHKLVDVHDAFSVKCDKSF
jgi:hypothetical protein